MVTLLLRVAHSQKAALLRLLVSRKQEVLTRALLKGQGIRIFTGAVVPDSCDTVIMQENTNFAYIKDNIDKTQPYEIILAKAADVDANIRKQGEEIQHNELVLQQGKRINPADISLLANLGIDKVKVFKPLTVGLVATGDELVALGGKLKVWRKYITLIHPL